MPLPLDEHKPKLDESKDLKAFKGEL